jgi:opacity protein-like surface antigen
MKNIKHIIIVALLTSAVSAPASAARYLHASSAPASAPTASQPVYTAPVRIAAVAAEPQKTPPPAAPVHPAAKNSAFYLGAQVGDSTIGAFMGYQISKMYAMEISYDYVDPVDTFVTGGATTRLEKSRVGVSGLALFPIKFSEMGPMSIYIKVGYGRTTENYTVNDPGLGSPSFPATTTITTTLTTGVTGGAGVQVDLSSNTTARLGASYVGGDRSVYLAAMYKF